MKQITTRHLTCILLKLCALLFAIQANAGSWQNNVSIGGFSKVHIYTPDTQSSIGQGRALLLVLHGCTQSIDVFLNANLEQAAETYGMVVAVPDAMNKAGYSCWSYWQGTISRTSGDYKNLIGLANALVADTSYNIDPDQRYITGLSSGAAFAAQTGCLAPDIFAGVAPSAGPTIGTSSNGAISTCETVSTSTFKSRCEGYAGSYKSHFATQVAVIGHGDADTTVNTCYNQQNADGFATVYGVSELSGSNPISEGSGHTADEHNWQDNRVAMLWFNGLDHSWSGGAGASGSYVSGVSINFANYLGQFFAANNKRVNRNQGPVMTNLSAVDSANQLSISGNAVDAEGSVAQVALEISLLDSGTPQLVQTITVTTFDGSGNYSALSNTLNDGLYEVVATGTDNEGKASDPSSVTVRVGPEPAAAAPVLSNTAVAVAGQCATVTGTVVDINQNLSSVVVAFSNGNVTATVNGNSYSAEQCNLAGGTNSATVTATDTGGLSSSDSISFTIDAGSTGDYNFHINEGHITWGNGYSACYLAFGTSAFTMREYPSGTDCQWIADGDSTCKGPVQVCSTSGGTGGTGGTGGGTGGGSTFTCTENTSSNYAHVVAGRATTNGVYAYAVGSGTNMGLYNLYVTTTLAQTSEGYYDVGTCP